MADQRKKDEKRAFYNQLYVSVITGLGGASMMFSMNFPTFGIPSMERDPNFEITPDQSTLIGSLVPAVAIFGNFGAGLLVDTVGRKKTVLAGGILYVIAYLLLGMATNVTQALASRALCGLGGSLMMIGGMIFMTETVEPSLRDRLGAISGVLVNAGMLAAFVCGSLMEWRGSAWAGLVGVLPMMLMLSFLTETPLFLIKGGKNKEALATLKVYRATEAEATKEYKELVESSRHNDESSVSIGEIFTPPYLTALLVPIVMLVAQQMTGITGVTTYAVNLFEYLGTEVDPSYCTVMIGVVNIITTIIGAEVHSRFDRKPTLMISTAVLVITEVFIGMFCWARESGGAWKTWSDANSSWALISVLLFFFSFNIGLGPMAWMYMGEGLPSKIRGPVSAIAITFSMLALFVILQVYNPMVASLGYHYSFFLFAAVTSVCVVVVNWLMVETRGRSISEMDDYYNDLKSKKRN